MRKNRLFWTDEENAKLHQMMAAGHNFNEIAEQVGRTRHSVKERWRWVNRTEEDKERRRALNNEARRAVRNGQPRIQPTRSVLNKFIPEQVFIDREERLAAPRSLSAVLLGDPPQGYSALERQRPTHIDRRLAQLQRAKPTLAGEPA